MSNGNTKLTSCTHCLPVFCTTLYCLTEPQVICKIGFLVLLLFIIMTMFNLFSYFINIAVCIFFCYKLVSSGLAV